MHDQANDLRRLVQLDGRVAPATKVGRPRLVVVAGAKGGVGTTTVAINLAVTLARQKQRTLLIDADADRGDVAVLSRLEQRYTLADVLAARKTLLEAIQPGPDGIGVLPGVRPDQCIVDQCIADCWSAAASRLIGPAEDLRPHFDCLVLDVGDCMNRTVRQLWQVADTVLLVTGADRISVMDAYGLVKVLAAGGTTTKIHLLVNMARTAVAADHAHARLAQICRRFLALELVNAGYLSADARVERCMERGEPFVTAVPACSSSRRLHLLARTLAGRPTQAHQTA